MKQVLTILGSTGSIGVNTLDVVARHPDRFEVFALSAASQVDLLLAQCRQFRPQFAVMAHEGPALALRERLVHERTADRYAEAACALLLRPEGARP